MIIIKVTGKEVLVSWCVGVRVMFRGTSRISNAAVRAEHMTIFDI